MDFYSHHKPYLAEQSTSLEVLWVRRLMLPAIAYVTGSENYKKKLVQLLEGFEQQVHRHQVENTMARALQARVKLCDVFDVSALQIAKSDLENKLNQLLEELRKEPFPSLKNVREWDSLYKQYLSVSIQLWTKAHKAIPEHLRLTSLLKDGIDPFDYLLLAYHFEQRVLTKDSFASLQGDQLASFVQEQKKIVEARNELLGQRYFWKKMFLERLQGNHPRQVMMFPHSQSMSLLDVVKVFNFIDKIFPEVSILHIWVQLQAVGAFTNE